MSDLVKRYTASVDFDAGMWRRGYSRRLRTPRCWPSRDHLRRGLVRHPARHAADRQRNPESGAFVWSLDLEDVHLNIEKRLTTLVGDAGKRLHQ